MRRKTLIRLALVVVVLGALLVILAWMLSYEPEFYRQKEIQAGKLRNTQGKEVENAVLNMIAAIQSDGEPWQASFTEAQINSYLQGRFIESGLINTVLPTGVSDPRVAIEGDLIRLGFRYGEPPWSTVVSVDFRVWMAPNETNTVALQLLALRAGMIPMSSKFLMDKVAALVRNSTYDIRLSWYRHEGSLVALLQFGENRVRSNQLGQLQVADGKLIIAGRSPTSPAAKNNPAPASPKVGASEP
jgi:hypothetical protein